jgi:hypothetical protein
MASLQDAGYSSWVTYYQYCESACRRGFLKVAERKVPEQVKEGESQDGMEPAAFCNCAVTRDKFLLCSIWKNLLPLVLHWRMSCLSTCHNLVTEQGLSLGLQLLSYTILNLQQYVMLSLAWTRNKGEVYLVLLQKANKATTFLPLCTLLSPQFPTERSWWGQLWGPWPIHSIAKEKKEGKLAITSAKVILSRSEDKANITLHALQQTLLSPHWNYLT